MGIGLDVAECNGEKREGPSEPRHSRDCTFQRRSTAGVEGGTSEPKLFSLMHEPLYLWVRCVNIHN